MVAGSTASLKAFSTHAGPTANTKRRRKGGGAEALLLAIALCCMAPLQWLFGAIQDSGRQLTSDRRW